MSTWPRVTLPDGTATMHRDSREAWFRTNAALSSDEMVHPMLGYAALAFANWMGREAFHAGVFLSGERAWALLGERGAARARRLGGWRATARRSWPTTCCSWTGAPRSWAPARSTWRRRPRRTWVWRTS